MKKNRFTEEQRGAIPPQADRRQETTGPCNPTSCCFSPANLEHRIDDDRHIEAQPADTHDGGLVRHFILHASVKNCFESAAA